MQPQRNYRSPRLKVKIGPVDLRWVYAPRNEELCSWSLVRQHPSNRTTTDTVFDSSAPSMPMGSLDAEKLREITVGGFPAVPADLTGYISDALQSFGVS